MSRTGSSQFPQPSLRAKIVWSSFLASMTLMAGLLALGDHRARPGFPATHTGLIGDSPALDPIFRIDAPLDRSRWKGIIIHHSGEPAGDAESMRRLYLAYGFEGMGYHFLIGNGNGMGDGVIHVGERWVKQLPGAHARGAQAQYHNQHSIGLCLIGNGNRRPLTDRQMTQLISLVRRLQRELNIPASAVRLHRDVAPGSTDSPGEYFPAAQLEQQLLNPLR
ncbi:MAG: N-acetylmuramoyl-L-alanine amidase [Planctomycetes bacterium]|nr:N-acetylmuramoyl-L-alanine amidase [Planctomycetota bacterium]